MKHNNPECIFCKSDKVIKHGKTTTGNARYRCRDCHRTWVLEKNEPVRPDLSEISEQYINGKTCRELVPIYHSSPLRINKKIREFLESCPKWEDYLDSLVEKHEPRLIFLLGRTFSCANKLTKTNSKFLAMAVDALSTVVLGFEVAESETDEVWFNLLHNLSSRNILCSSFMSNGTTIIEDSVHSIYPSASIRINYQRAYRDKELMCCLYRAPINNKLINDAIRIYNSLGNHGLNYFLRYYGDRRLPEILFNSSEEFLKRVRDRVENKNTQRIEGLGASFQTRFEKFHMLKEDPYPLINGWIAQNMIKNLPIGFNRLSIYLQTPYEASFKLFSTGTKPELINFDDDYSHLKSFVIEIAARSLQLPIIVHNCEMKSDKCSLI